MRCPIISSEERSLVHFEEFAVYCDCHGLNEYKEILRLDSRHYYEMQIADYILGNSDRHGLNWGVYMDNRTGAFQGLYPLMDHDRAFAADSELYSQTTEQEGITLKEAALLAQNKINLPVNTLLAMEQPETLTAQEWESVLGRVKTLC